MSAQHRRGDAVGERFGVVTAQRAGAQPADGGLPPLWLADLFRSAVRPQRTQQIDDGLRREPVIVVLQQAMR